MREKHPVTGDGNTQCDENLEKKSGRTFCEKTWLLLLTFGSVVS